MTITLLTLVQNQAKALGVEVYGAGTVTSAPSTTLTDTAKRAEPDEWWQGAHAVLLTGTSSRLANARRVTSSKRAN